MPHETHTYTNTYQKKRIVRQKVQKKLQIPQKAELKSPKNEHGRVIMCIIISGININIDNTTTTHQRNTRTTTTTPLYYYYYYNTGRLTSALMLKAPRLR